MVLTVDGIVRDVFSRPVIWSKAPSEITSKPSGSVSSGIFVQY